MRIPSFFPLLALFFSTWSGAVSSVAAEAIVVRDFSGAEVRLEKPAERVVCLIESALSGLYMLGVQDKVVAVSTNVYQDAVHRYYAAMDPRIADQKLPTPGNWDFVSLESVVALRPDLVIIWASQKEIIENLRAKGIAVYGVELTTFADIFRETEDFGKLFGRGQRAGELRRYAEKEMADLASTAATIPVEQRPGVYFMWPQGPLETSGSPSTVSDLIELAGGRNVAGGISQEHLVVNLEKLIAWQPQVVVMWPNPRLSPKELAGMPIWAKLPAARDNRIHQLPSVFFCDLWTLKFVHAVRLMASWYHPGRHTPEQLVDAQRAMLIALYGVEVGGRIPLDQ
jgi:iron complex transport system substrate-binding protein